MDHGKLSLFKLTQFYFALFFCLIILSLGARSIYRPERESLPCIITNWVGDTQTHELRHSHLEVSPIFDQYDKEYLAKHALPDETIPPRLETHTPTQGATLKKLLNTLVREIQQYRWKRSHYTDFHVLKNRDYNPKTKSGLIILKCKHHPFVVKLFLVTPRTFVRPFAEGFEPIIFFLMGGGTKRFLAGFNRIKNAELLRQKIADSPEWCNKILIPRKWFWEPEDQQMIEIRSQNMGPRDYHLVLPSIYAIVCDAIETKETFSIFSAEQRAQALEIVHFLGISVDPHINNFMYESDENQAADEQVVVLVDTEPFTGMVGLREPIDFNSYSDWYSTLTIKGIKDCYFRPKPVRKALQYTTDHQIISCNEYRLI